MGIILSLTVIAPPQLEARVRCAGSACITIPADDLRRQIAFLSLQLQYQEVIRRQNIRAASTANLMHTGPGARRLESWSIGIGTGAAWTAAFQMEAHVPGAGSFIGMPISGMASQPSLSLGGNLEFILKQTGLGKNSGPSRSLFSPGRLDLFFHFAHMRTQDYDIARPKENSVSGIVKSRGLELRYYLLDAVDLDAEGDFRFLGLSLGTGYYGTHNYLTVYESTNRSGYYPYEGAFPVEPVIWDQSNTVNMKTTLNTLPVEVRGGWSFFNFDMYIGIGIVYHKGIGRMSTIGSGFLYNSSNLQGALEGALLGASVRSDGFMAMLLSGHTDVNLSKGYSRLGIEAGTNSIRANIEFIVDPHARGLYLGLRYLW